VPFGSVRGYGESLPKPPRLEQSCSRITKRVVERDSYSDIGHEMRTNHSESRANARFIEAVVHPLGGIR
jgi:hypothetical protein